MKDQGPRSRSAEAPRLRQQLGQHHLRQPEMCRPLLEFLRPRRRTVVEVGAGGGVLTEALVSAGARVVAMDLDAAWLFKARRRLCGEAVESAPHGAVRWLVADATRFDWRRLPSGWLVAGNLPYNVATPIVRAVLASTRAPRMGFLVQREVAERIVAVPGTRRYGLLTLQVAWWAEAEILGKVKPGSFHPPPNVESSFVGFTRRSPPADAEVGARLMRVAGAAFSQRRKTLANALRSHYRRSDVVDWCTHSGLPPDVRAEQLSLRHYLELVSTLSEPIARVSH